MKTIKKWMALLLTAVLLLSCCTLLSFAAPEDLPEEPVVADDGLAEPDANHTHSYLPENYVFQRAYYKCITIKLCQYIRVYTCKCTSCPVTTEIEVKSDATEHSDRICAASCNGTYQTHQYECRNCGAFLYKKPLVCRNGPHTGACTCLPV